MNISTSSSGNKGSLPVCWRAATPARNDGFLPLLNPSTFFALGWLLGLNPAQALCGY